VPSQWTISQIGARQHYGIPRGFQQAGTLRSLYTDSWCRFGHTLLARGTPSMRALAGRRQSGIPNQKVTAFTLRTAIDYYRHQKKTWTLADEYHDYLRVGHWFSKAVAADLARHTFDPASDVFFGFNTACLETMQVMNDRRVLSICDQIDPGLVEEEMVAAEAEKWPGWQRQPGRIPGAYWARMRAEWAAASLVLVNSGWSKRALERQGVPAEKMFVVPVAYEARQTRPPVKANLSGPFTVLWIGTVNLRKGIQYLIDAARRLTSNPAIRFVVAGPMAISDDAVASAPANLRFVGRVTRDQTERMYRDADLFVIPTVSDGFAITQVEAMAQALPVVTTPNCGDVVTAGVDGLIVPACDGVALAAAIESLEADRPRVRQMSYQAIEKSKQFGLARQTDLIEQAVATFRAGRLRSETKPRLD
jgi:glycosyltransferase involved in cell wall biosynthesis